MTAPRPRRRHMAEPPATPARRANGRPGAGAGTQGRGRGRGCGRLIEGSGGRGAWSAGRTTQGRPHGWGVRCASQMGGVLQAGSASEEEDSPQVGGTAQVGGASLVGRRESTARCWP